MGGFCGYVLVTYLIIHWVLVLTGGGFNAGPELPPVITAQQQQAEQMKVYWKVRTYIPSTVLQPQN